jgi:hypothetical protein
VRFVDLSSIVCVLLNLFAQTFISNLLICHLISKVCHLLQIALLRDKFDRIE